MRPHLALIEDDPDFALMCRSCLEREGFTVTWAMDARAGQAVSAVRPPRRHLAILIVEDNTDLAATYRTLLERQGHHVTTVHTGADALTATQADLFDVVLCDLGLPDIDGYTVARGVRARPHVRRIRLIAVSGFSQGTDRALSRAAGFDTHWAKPLPLTDLLDLLERT